MGMTNAMLKQLAPIREHAAVAEEQRLDQQRRR